jgi:hypothetical protein
MNNQVNKIQLDYPELYTISRKLNQYDKKVKDLFITNYGDNTYDNLMITNEYHKELENVSNGILKDTDLSKLAQKRQEIFKEYSVVTFEITKTIGFSKTLLLMDILDKYFKYISNLI